MGNVICQEFHTREVLSRILDYLDDDWTVVHDYGCGAEGGGLTALAEHFDEVVGFDVANKTGDIENPATGDVAITLHLLEMFRKEDHPSSKNKKDLGGAEISVILERLLANYKLVVVSEHVCVANMHKTTPEIRKRIFHGFDLTIEECDKPPHRVFLLK